MDNLTKTDKKQLKKEQKLLERGFNEKKKRRSRLIKNFIKYSLVILILALLSYGFLLFNSNKVNESNKFKEGNVHWHATASIFVCGEYKSLEHLGTEEHHAGLPLLHTHGDNLIHIEGEPLTYDDITLGKFFKSIDIPFNNSRIMEKSNGDKCPNGKEGKLNILLNNKPLENPVNYSVKDSDKFEIRFE